LAIIHTTDTQCVLSIKAGVASMASDKCDQYGRWMVHTLAGVAGAAGAWFIRTES